MGLSICIMVQVKSTPLKNPRNKGGSPIGGSEPPILETKNIKNTIKCILFFLDTLALIRGLINNIEAPVVPINDAKIVPVNIIMVFTKGVPAKKPCNLIPPEIVKSEKRRIIKGIYSRTITCINWFTVSLNPYIDPEGV